MLLPRFNYHEPTTLEEACQIMAEFREKAMPLAGGTDLLVNMKKGIVSTENVVSLNRVGEFTKIDHSNGLLKIGACQTAAELAKSNVIKPAFSSLNQGANSLGSPLIRNLATIGGNLVSARPAADLPPPLMAYGANVALKNSSRERIVSLEEFFRGPGQTIMEPDEILTEISLKKPPPKSGASYIKLGIRRALEISIVNVASFITLDNQDGTIRTARVVLGAVAPTPIRAVSAENLLIGEEPDDFHFSRAGEAAAKDSKPIDDFRGSARYRRAMVKVLTQRSLNIALEKAKENS